MVRRYAHTTLAQDNARHCVGVTLSTILYLVCIRARTHDPGIQAWPATRSESYGKPRSTIVYGLQRRASLPQLLPLGAPSECHGGGYDCRSGCEACWCSLATSGKPRRCVAPRASSKQLARWPMTANSPSSVFDVGTRYCTVQHMPSAITVCSSIFARTSFRSRVFREHIRPNWLNCSELGLVSINFRVTSTKYMCGFGHIQDGIGQSKAGPARFKRWFRSKSGRLRTCSGRVRQLRAGGFVPNLTWIPSEHVMASVNSGFD